MKSRKTFVALLSLASLCAALPASAQTAREPGRDAQVAGAAAASPVHVRDARVEFEGNRVFSAEQLSKAVAGCYERLPVDGREAGLALLDYCVKTDVRWMLLRAGYVRAVVREPRAEMWGLSQKFVVPVEENEFYRLGRVRIEGAEFFPAKGLRELLPLKRDEVADAVAVTRWLGEHLKRKYADEGFIRYEFEVRPEFNVEAGAAEGVVDFAVTVREGKRFRLRRLDFGGGENLPSDVMRGALRLAEGEVFSAQGFRDAVARLNELDLFGAPGRFDIVDGDEDVEFRTDEESGRLDIKINLTERGQGPRRGRGAPEAPGAEGRAASPTLTRRR